MFRAASKLLLGQQRTASGWVTNAVTEPAARPLLTDFVRRAAHLKSRLRGKAQYAFAREMAQRFLDAEVPKTDLSTWIDDGGNATALAQLLQFFEIQPEASVASLLFNKLIRHAEDGSAQMVDRLSAALCLLHFRPEENYERVFQLVGQALLQLERTPPASLQSGTVSGRSGELAAAHSYSDVWAAIGLCCKLLQRCGRRVPPSMNDDLTKIVLAHLAPVTNSDAPALQNELLRVYAWMVRAERPEANQLLLVLLEWTGGFSPPDFASMLLSCLRHNHFVPLPIELVERLIRAAFDYSATVSARNAGAILGSLAKIIHTLTPNANGVTTDSLYRVQDLYSALLDEHHERVVRFMSPVSPLFSNNAEDVTSCVFALELGGHARYRSVFEAYGSYVQSNVEAFEPPQLALATGILRRAQLLTPQLAARLSERLEVVLGELRLAELSHICATFAALPGPRPAWWQEAKAVALRLHTPDSSGVAQLNLAIAFADEPALAHAVDYAQITSKQLVDVLSLTLGSPQFEHGVTTALCARLTAAGERFAPDDLRTVFASGRPALLQAAQEHLRRAFAEPRWNTDTLFSLPLVCDPHHPEQNVQAFSPAKALAAAKTAALGPRVFVSLSELLLTVYSDGDEAIRQFVQVGGMDLVKGTKAVSVATARLYLALMRRYPSIAIDPAWLHSFADALEAHWRMPRTALEDLLLSLRTLYQDVGKTPALQRVLACLVENNYSAISDVDEATARITVMLVYLQCGMTLPLLTSSHPLVAKVTHNDVHYAPEVRKALAMMPLPKPAPAEERRGRFVLKHLDKAAARGPDPIFTLDLNTADPFELPFDAGAEATKAAPVSAAATAPPAAPPAAATEAPAAATAAAQVAPPADTAQPGAPAEEQQQQPPQAGGSEPSPPEKPLSYYAKFFNSSVGQLLTGFEQPDKSSAEKKSEAAPETPQPRRTRLQPTAHAAAAAPSSPPPPPPPAPAAAAAAAPFPFTSPSAGAPSAVPVTSFTTAWGAPPTPSAPPSSATAAAPTAAAAVMPGWGFAGSPLASAVGGAAAAAETHHSTAFSSLFGSPPVAAAAAASTAPSGMSVVGGRFGATPPPPPPPAAAAAAASGSGPAAGMRASVAGGNNVFFDPSNPSAQRSRPVISRKAVITRQSGFGQGAAASPAAAAAAATATAEQEEMRRIYDDASRAKQMSGPASGYAGGPQVVLDVAAVPGAAASSSFLHKTGVTKITGYNMDGEATATAAAEAGSDGQSAVDWTDTARRVARVSRHPRMKAKTRTHTNLSAWLSTPTARLGAATASGQDTRSSSGAAAGGSGAATTVPPLKPSGGRQATVAEAVHQRKSKRKDKAAATAAEKKAEADGESGAAAAAAAAAAPAPASSNRRGSRKTPPPAAARTRGGRAAAAKGTKAAKAAAKPAAAKKKVVAKKATAAKAPKAAAAAGGRGKRASSAAAKPAVKSARKTVKAAAAKKAPVPKKKAAAAGKGKKK